MSAVCIPYIDYSECYSSYYEITTLILIGTYVISLAIIIGTIKYRSRLSWQPSDYISYPLLGHTILFIWILGWKSTQLSSNIILKLNLILFSLAHIFMFITCTMVFFLWVGINNTSKKMVLTMKHNDNKGKRKSFLRRKTKYRDYIIKCLIVNLIVGLPLLSFNIVAALLLNTTEYYIPLRLYWGYFGISGLIILIPFLWYGYQSYKIARESSNRSIATKILIMGLFMSLATPLVIAAFITYAIEIEVINSNPMMTSFIHLFIGLSDNIIILYTCINNIIKTRQEHQHSKGSQESDNSIKILSRTPTFSDYPSENSNSERSKISLTSGLMRSFSFNRPRTNTLKPSHSDSEIHMKNYQTTDIEKNTLQSSQSNGDIKNIGTVSLSSIPHEFSNSNSSSIYKLEIISIPITTPSETPNETYIGG